MVEERIAKLRELARELDMLDGQRSKIDTRIREVKKEIVRLMDTGTEKEDADVDVDTVQSSAFYLGPLPRKPTKADLAFSIVNADPSIDYEELAKRLYGSDDTESKNKTRSVMFALKKAGKVDGRSHGRWVIIETKG